MSKATPQTSDPGENYGVSGGVAGQIDRSATRCPVRKLNTSNPKNGSGGSCRTIDPSKVKGINP